MKKISWPFVFLLLLSSVLNAQKVYFIYLQTDNLQPFYARMGEKVYNSSSAGHLILSNLRDSVYSVNIGIQGGQTSDLSYNLTVNRKDQGFLIKNFGDKGWGLFNISTMAVTMPVAQTVAAVQTVKTEKREDNPFTNLLAKAADDSTIKERPIIVKVEDKKKTEPVLAVVEKKEEQKAELKDNNPAPKQDDIKKEVLPVEQKQETKADSSLNKAPNTADTIAVKEVKTDQTPPVFQKNENKELLKQDSIKTETPSENRVNEMISNTEVYKKSTVKLKSESSTSMGIGFVFLDQVSNDKTDTIKIFIPAETKKPNPVITKQEEKKFLDIPSIDSIQTETVKPVIAAINNNCKIVANDDDFFKLRRKMAGESNDNDMISEAGKDFKTKCFSTQQLKNLSTLFLTDEFKYKFFDTAYQYVSDPENFSSLQSELKDDYYINRFKAMLR